MRQATSRFNRQIDKKVWWGYYRPLIWAGVVVVAIPLSMAGCNAYIHRQEEKEWAGAARLQSEATCISAHSLNSRMISGWVNTFRIKDKELTSRDEDGCLVGKRYHLTYRIGRTGQLKVQSGKML